MGVISDYLYCPYWIFTIDNRDECQTLQQSLLYLIFHTPQNLQQTETAIDSPLCEILQTAMTTIKQSQSGEIIHGDKDHVIRGKHLDSDFTVVLTVANGTKCERCRRNTAKTGELCQRCSNVLLHIGNMEAKT